MPPSCDLLLASSNGHKYSEARRILGGLGVRLGLLRCRLEEVQSGSLARISEGKARDAFARCGRPVIAEDAGLFVASLGGFPGPYSSYAFGTIGNRGILRLVGPDRSARFVSVVTYFDGRELRSFRGAVDGSIARRERGAGWGYDPIFVADGAGPFSSRRAKDGSSHRRRALEGFARWYLRTRGSSGSRAAARSGARRSSTGSSRPSRRTSR